MKCSFHRHFVFTESTFWGSIEKAKYLENEILWCMEEYPLEIDKPILLTRSGKLLYFFEARPAIVQSRFMEIEEYFGSTIQIERYSYLKREDSVRKWKTILLTESTLLRAPPMEASLHKDEDFSPNLDGQETYGARG